LVKKEEDVMSRVVVLNSKKLTDDYLHAETVQDMNRIHNIAAIMQNTIREL
jgi:hypothetical protein